MELDEAPLLDDASIRDFQQGTARYVADTVEQSLQLPTDMANLKFMRQHKVFLGLKRDLAMVIFFFFLVNCTSLPFQAIQVTFRVEVMVNYSHQKMKEEEGRRITVVDAFHVAEKSIQGLRVGWPKRKGKEKVL